MKRPVLALAAGILLLALLPSSTVAAAVVDQSNDPGGLTYGGTGSRMAQTFTAGKTGLLKDVELYLTGGGRVDFSIETTSGGLPTGVVLFPTQSTVTSPAGWVDFSTGWTRVTAGEKYAIVFELWGPLSMWGSGDAYSGGEALAERTSWGATGYDLQDFAFKTYVDPQTTTVQWDKPQIVAGSSTALALTETIVFPTYGPGQTLSVDVKPNLAAAVWTVRMEPLPSWFAVTAVACSSQIADCSLANVLSGSGALVTPDSNPITVTFTGTASPALTDAGTPGTAFANGCVDYGAAPSLEAGPAAYGVQCVAAKADVAVVLPAATPAPTPAPTPTPTATPSQSVPAVTAAPVRTNTPPPTSTGVGSASDNTNSSIWLLPFGLVVAIGGAVLLINRQQRRIR
jgi:hypothetical protein